MARRAGAGVAALLCCLACGLGSAPARAEPAALKLQVHLDAGVIKVGDLWGNAGAKGETVVGPAPPPGRSIAVEAGQLAYIARLYDVDWRPTSGVERTLVERAGRPLSREEMAEPIRRSLVEAGAPANAGVEFLNFAPIQVPPASFPLLTVEAIGYDQGGERFTATLVAATEGMQTQRMRVAGRVVRTVAGVVATRRLAPGEAIRASDVRAVQVADRGATGGAVTDVSQVIGQAPKRAIVAGQALTAADVGTQVMVAKGETVAMALDTPGMSLTAQGVALGPGGRGDVIQVMNPLSRAVVAARVTGPGRAVIAPGSTPLVAAANARQRNSEVAN